jgi:hypothetical protein
VGAAVGFDGAIGTKFFAKKGLPERQSLDPEFG